MPRPRTILSITRTVVYASLTVVLALWRGEIKGFTDTILVGAVCGDYLTWLVWSLIELPENLVHGCYEVCVNTLFGLLIFRLGDLNLRADLNAEFTAVMFLAFLLVSGTKAFCLSVVFVEQEMDDD
ncbi:MAG TPA: hypothetical protein VL486_10170 [Verrucomicrobiae bacterium]|nr:hypothetical protein [Verrucomicrobiae bacterium]